MFLYSNLKTLKLVLYGCHHFDMNAPRSGIASTAERYLIGDSEKPTSVLWMFVVDNLTVSAYLGIYWIEDDLINSSIFFFFVIKLERCL